VRCVTPVSSDSTSTSKKQGVAGRPPKHGVVRPRTRIFRLAAAAGALGVVAVPSPASAASSVESRWWSASPLFAAPDVGADQLLVQGSPDPNTPLAYAGISFSLAAGELPSKLVLQQAPDSASSPGAKLALCALKGAATSETAPGFDCTTKADGTAGADGASYEFDVSALVGSGSLDVAVVPGQPTDRVVLVKPGAEALQSSGGSSSDSTSTSTDSTSTGSTGFDSGTSGGGFSSFDSGSGSFDVPSTPLPSASAPSTSTATTVPKREVQLAAPAAATSPLGGGDGDGRSIAPFAFFGMAAAAAALWSVAGRESEELEGATVEA
jgi:hypothetical protein